MMVSKMIQTMFLIILTITKIFVWLFVAIDDNDASLDDVDD